MSSDPRPCQGDLFQPGRAYRTPEPTCADCVEIAFEAAWLHANTHDTPGYGKCLGAAGMKELREVRDA
jgi:hypothetical protein